MEESVTTGKGARNEPLDIVPLSTDSSAYDSTEEHTTYTSLTMDEPPLVNDVTEKSVKSAFPGSHESEKLARIATATRPMEVPKEEILSLEAREEGTVRSSKLEKSVLKAMPCPATENPPRSISTSLQPIAAERGNFVDFLNSPGQYALVEQSPEGRYVRFMEKLGSGASKDVYRAYDTTEGIEVAWNVVNLAGVHKSERNRIVDEVRLLERLHHQNIISFHGSWVNRERLEVNFVTEILSSGTLKSFIEKVQVIRWKIAKRWAVQILKGLDYLHSQKPPVIHRDLKCDNIFINGASGDLRIGDLGLSTVYTNGKVLSVLGTPEFMAPDLYEESAYDEKVDIYAFGMCLLEIFTKEIPYRECNNAAQIYKKVLRGELPSNLRRLKSEKAREFIMLCLGYKDKSGRYVRPSAAELLNNPFLQKCDYDDDEVEVMQPMHERPIMETSVESRQRSHSQELNQPQCVIDDRIKAEVARPRNRPTDTCLEEESDRFDEMPDSEVNMKKVKVMMGRGEELKERVELNDDEMNDNTTSHESIIHKTDSTLLQNALDDEENTGLQNKRVQSSGPISGFVVTTVIERHTLGGENQLADIRQQYLVAAAVTEEDSPHFVPYEDDMLKLIITLPVEGQPQNVQFDFHLVQDDPVQVAREMVAELGIPEDTILEISEIISGIARQARMKQDKYNIARRQNEQGQGQLVQQQSLASQQQQPQHQRQHSESTSQVQQHMQTQVYHRQHQSTQLGQTSDAAGVAQIHGSTQNESAQVYHQQLQHNQSGQPFDVSSGILFHESSQNESTHVYHQLQPNQSATPSEESRMVPPQGQSESATVYHPQQQVNQDIQGSNGLGMTQFQGSSQSEPDYSTNAGTAAQWQQEMQLQTQPPSVLATVVSKESTALMPMQIHSQLLVSSQETKPALPYTASTLPPAPLYPLQMPGVGDTIGLVGMISSQPQVFQPENRQPAISSQQYSKQPLAPPVVSLPTEYVSSFSLPHVGLHVPQIVGQQLVMAPTPQAEYTPHVAPLISKDSIDAVVLVPDPPSTSSHSRDIQTSVTDEEDELEEEFAADIRRLDEDFQKNMLRAQKVFDNRMDNLQRSKQEKEFQHQKTLEKHEKERIDIEKRARQEEILQTQRIGEMQREWDRKRDELAKAKAKKQDSGTKKSPDNPRPHPRPGQGDPQPSLLGQSSLLSFPDEEESQLCGIICPPSLQSDSQRSNSTQSIGSGE